MPTFMYVSLQRDDRIAQYILDPATGAAEHRADYALTGMPAPMAVDPQRRFLFVGRRQAGEYGTHRLFHSARDRAPGTAEQRPIGWRPGSCIRGSQRTLPAVRLLLSSAGRRPRFRCGRQLGGNACRMAGNRHRRPLCPNRPAKPVRIRPPHRRGQPHRSQRDLPVPV